MTEYCKEKAVLVAVYVEGPRRRRLTSNNHHHHHHHHHHHLYVHQSKHGTANGKGHNRRAELLDYSRRLRESARSGGATSTTHPKPPNNQQPITKIFTVESKPKHGKGPTCLGDWKILIPSFLRPPLTVSQAKKDGRKKKKKSNSESIATKIKAFMKSFQVQKKGGFIPTMCATIQKRR